MHFEILVEGQTEKVALSLLMHKIVGPYRQPHTWNIRKHQGKGRLPADPRERPNQRDRTLLHNLPSLLRAYGRSLQNGEVVVVLVDADVDDCVALKRSMSDLLNLCEPRPHTIFRIAVEELEAWYLGDAAAIESAYPNLDRNVLASYRQDSICQTWELLLKIVEPNMNQTTRGRDSRLLELKSNLTKFIAPHLNIDSNNSPSFNGFCRSIKNLIGREEPER